MANIDLIKILPDNQELGDIAFCLVSPAGIVYYSTCKIRVDMSIFIEKFGLLEEWDEYWYPKLQKKKEMPTRYDFLIDKGYAYLWAGETVPCYPDAETMEHGWHYKEELLTPIQKQIICQLTGISQLLSTKQNTDLSGGPDDWKEKHNINCDIK